MPTVTLKEGIDLQELQSGVGTEFEVDPSAPLPGGSREEEAREEEFDQEEILQHLNFDCMDLGREGSAEVRWPLEPLHTLSELTVYSVSTNVNCHLMTSLSPVNSARYTY